MPISFVRARIIRLLGVLLVAAAALSAGCSAVRMVYGQAPNLTYWWLDRYADFDSNQTPRVRDALTEWFRWQRNTQLAGYADLLARAAAEVQRPTTAAQACRWAEDVAARVTVAFDHAVPAIAGIALTLTPEQIHNIERHQAKTNDEFRDDYLQADAKERRDAAVKRTIERAEMVYGPLDTAQRDAIARGVAASPFDADRWLAERRARQVEVIELLKRLIAERASQKDAEAAFRTLAQHMVRSPRDDYRNYEQRLVTYNCAFVAEVHNLTAPKQRDAASLKLKGWETDLRSLAVQPD